MPTRSSLSANVDRNRFIALYAAMAVGLLVAAGMFPYEGRVVLEGGLRDEEAFVVL